MKKSSKKKKESYKRVHFRMSRDLMQKFDEAAKAAGLTKSKLIKEWIGNPIESLGINTSSKKTVGFNYRLSNQRLKKVDSLAQENNLNRSDYLRSLIFANVNISSRRSSLVQQNGLLETLWQAGTLSTIVDLYENRIESLSNDDLITLAKTYIEIGDLAKGGSVLRQISLDKLRGGEYWRMKGYILVLRAEMARLQLDFENMKKYLNEAKSLIGCFDDRTLVQKIYYQLGLQGNYLDDMPTSMGYLRKSLSYAMRNNDAIGIIKSYLWLSMGEGMNLNIPKAKEYLMLAGDQVTKINNKYYKGHYTYMMSVIKGIEKDYSTAEGYIESSLDYFYRSGSRKENHYVYNNSARLQLCNGGIDTSYKLLKEAQKYEDNLRGRVPASSNNLYEILIKSRDCYEESDFRFQKAIESNKYGFKKDMNDCLLGTMKYLNGRSKGEKGEGEIILKRIKFEGGYELVKRAANDTLTTREIQIIR